MSEQEKKEQTLTQETQIRQEYTEDDLRVLLVDLWMLEENLFSNKDWIVDGNSGDSEIDKKYKEWLKKAKDIKTKIELVQRLYWEFSRDSYIKTTISSHLDSKKDYLDDEDRDNIYKIQEETQKILNDYPEYKEVIVNHIESNFDKLNYIVSNYQKNWIDKKIISNYLKIDYKLTLNEWFNRLRIILEHINKSEKIIDKKNIVDNFLNITKSVSVDFSWMSEIEKNNDPYWLKKLDKIYNFDFTNKSQELDIYNLLKIWIKDLEYINKLYKENNKQELISFIDNLENKNDLLKIESIKKIYLEERKNEYDIKDLDFWRLDDVLLKIEKIKDLKTKEKIINLLKEFKNGGINVGNKEQKEKELNEIFSSALKDISKNINDDDKINDNHYELSILHSIAITFSTDFTLEQIEKLQENIWKNVNIRLLKLEEKLSNPNDLYRYKKWLASLRENDNSPENTQLKLDYYNSFSLWKNTYSQGIRWKAEEEKKQPKITESKKAQIQYHYQKLWLKVQVWNNWEILWKYWEKSFSQKLQGWKIEVWADEKMIYTTSLWYKFEFENSEFWAMKVVEITQRFDYLNKIWLGYFGENFKKMMDCIPSFLPNQALRLNIDEKTWDFLDQVELGKILEIFINIWFLENINFSQNISNIQEVTDGQMMYRVWNLENWSAFIDWKFDIKLFWELLQEKNKV